MRVDHGTFDVIVVDNGSGDDSLPRLRRAMSEAADRTRGAFVETLLGRPSAVPPASAPRWILIPNARNDGFTGGNNHAVEFALAALDPTYVLLLNNDTTVDPHFLTHLVRRAERDPAVGCVGPRAYFYAQPTMIQFAGGGFVTPILGRVTAHGWGSIDGPKWNEPMTLDYIGGACILIRASVLREVGLLDPDYFAYWEETDLCARVRSSGHTCVYEPFAKIWHKGGAASGKVTSTYYMARNRFIFLKKNASSRVHLLFLAGFFFFGFWLGLCTLLIEHRSFELVRAYSQGTWDGLRGQRGRFQQRRSAST